MFFKIQKFPENLRADFLKLFIQVFLSHISALPNTNLYSPFSIFSSVSRLSPTATADMPMSASSWTCSSVIAFNALTMITWQFFLPFTNSKICGYSWKIKHLNQILLVTNPTRLSFVAVLPYISFVHPLNNRYWENFREHFLSLLPNSRPPFLFTHLDHATSSSRGTKWPISMTVYLMEGRALAEQQEQWSANRRRYKIELQQTVERRTT